MSLIEQILKEGYGNTDKEKVQAAITEIRNQGVMNPFMNYETVLGDKCGIEISFFDGALWISSITSYEPGGGKYGLEIILKAADKYGVICRLSPEPFGKKTLNKAKLKAWYKRHGFKDRGYDNMERLPQK